MKLSKKKQNEINDIFNKLNPKEITSHHQKVIKNSVFIALKGSNYDGREFINDAINFGAILIIYEKKNYIWDKSKQIKSVGLLNLKAKLGAILSIFYKNHKRDIKIIGVTGTNGKTSVTHFLASSLNALGKKVGLIGTVGYGIFPNLRPSSLTTPDPFMLQKKISEFDEKNCEFLIMEVSSHAISQKRIQGINFMALFFLNLSHDHLDYHKSMKKYKDTKFSIFFESKKLLIINTKCKYGLELYNLVENKNKISTNKINSDHYCKEYKCSFSQTSFYIDNKIGKERILISTKIIGEFNIENLVMVYAFLRKISIESSKIKSVFKSLKNTPGRMQVIKRKSRYFIVDYAHSPDALEKLLISIRNIININTQKIICIFGCGGNRDTSKRSIMGRISKKNSDLTIITNDNPRFENPENIAKQITASTGKNTKVILDRADAIEYAMNNSLPNDVIVVAGKGHEQYQEVAGKRIKFSDINTINKLS